jgi:hypothetical protein
MKIRVSGRPGELQERVEDVVKVIRKLAGDCDHDHLEKASGADQVPRKLDLPVLQGGVDRASKTVQRIRNKMVHDMLEVIREAR